MNDMILIYTHSLTERLTYTMDLVFKTVLGTSYELTDDPEVYRTSSLPKIAYTREKMPDGYFLKSSELLFETSIKNVLPEPSGEILGIPIFFKTSANSFLPYDVFATVFFFATRYEEYLPSETDVHERFQAEHSLAYKHQVLHTPFLNHLITDFAQRLKQQFSQLVFSKPSFHFLSTIDIDNAFAYAHKGFKRNAGGLLKDLAFFKWDHLLPRLISNIRDSRDPYNTFPLINQMSQDTQTDLQYFVLIGDYSSYDKNPSPSNTGFRKLLKSLSQQYPIGLHPSYDAFTYPEKLDMEKKRLEDAIEKKVTSARCHFLRIKFPETYRRMMEVGITDDYTMIYASQTGFRTGLCMPYPWFDLQKNRSTSFIIHPSTVMEGTLRDYNSLSAVKASQTIKTLLQEVKHYGGEFVSVWHNDSFVPSQRDWINVYETLLRTSKL